MHLLNKRNKNLPNNIKNKAPALVFRFPAPIRGKIFNYKETMEKLDVNNFIENYENSSCNCSESDFVNSHHGHVITGDLSFIKNTKLKTLVSGQILVLTLMKLLI